MKIDEVIYPSGNKPLKSRDAIRVYHGFNDFNDFYSAISTGITGKELVNRRYSYENNNNPRGLFVSKDLDVAKEFGDFVIEFHTKIEDLDAPVWPSGTYTSQGEYAEYFDNDDDRAQEKSRLSKELRNSGDDFVSKSDKPDVTNSLFKMGESQALFTGNLNPNSIRAVWVNQRPGYVDGTFKRYKRTEYLKKFDKEGQKSRYDSSYSADDTDRKNKSKLFLPRESVTVDKLTDKLSKKHPHLDKEEIKDILIKNKDHDQFLLKFVWDNSQLRQLKNDLK